nr:TolC family protein [Microbacterium invictum]
MAEFWWIAPTAVGAGAVGWIGVRHQRAENARRLEYEAARSDLRAARAEGTKARVTVKVARAELARSQAERAAGRASSADVAAARRELQRAEREYRAAGAGVRSYRAQVSAARAVLPTTTTSDPSTLPVGRLMASHDTVIARWLDYETDPAKLIAFPAMSDARQPLTADFLTASATAHDLRPASARARMTTTDFAAYRDAVRGLEQSFNAAEERAWQLARSSGSIPPDAEPHPTPPAPTLQWTEFAQNAISKGADALARAAEVARQAASSHQRGDAGSAAPPASARPWQKPQPTPPAAAAPQPERRTPAPTPPAQPAAPPADAAAAPRPGEPAPTTPAEPPVTRQPERPDPEPQAPAGPRPAPKTWPIPSRTQGRVRRPEGTGSDG